MQQLIHHKYNLVLTALDGVASLEGKLPRDQEAGYEAGEFNAAMDGIESLIVALAARGILPASLLGTPELEGAIDDAVDACVNHLE